MLLYYYIKYMNKYTVTLLSNYEVITLEVTAEDKTGAQAIALTDCVLRGYSNVEIMNSQEVK